MKSLVWWYDKGLPTLPESVTGVVVKSSDGVKWLADWRKTGLEPAGPADIDAWVQRVAPRKLHLWCVPNGSGDPWEAERIIQACLRPGVASMTLDVEPYEGFWSGPKTNVRVLMEHVRRAVGASFPIGMAVDPRPQHYAAIWPAEWRPYVDYVALQIYWRTFKVHFSRAIDEAYETWGTYEKPLIPILQGDAPNTERQQANGYVRSTYGASTVHWWRLGDMVLDGLPG
jgi:hypothetical protein